MKKLLLTIALVLLCGATMAQNLVEFTFTRNGENASVTVNGAEDVTATISATSPNPNCAESTGVWNTGNTESNVNAAAGTLATRTEVLCTSTNTNVATEAAPITYTLTVEGLGKATLNSVSFYNVAANNNGGFQKNDGSTRTRNLELKINGAFKQLFENVNIWPGTAGGSETWLEKEFTFDQFEAINTKDGLTITMSLYMPAGTTGEAANGVFYGLTKIALNITPEPEPTPVAALYHLSGKNLTASELMAKTEPTYIAIKGLANANKHYFNYVSEQTYTSVELFNQSAVFVWEPTGEEGKFYLKKLENGYMQKDAPGKFAETTDNAVIFEAVQPSTTGTGHLQCNRDGIYEDPGTDYYVRIVATNKDETCWLSLGNHVHSSQNVEYTTTRKGTVTFYQICELKGFDENVNVTIKNTGDVDFATFYSNAPVEMPEGVTAYYVKEDGINNGYITLAADEDGIIAGNTAVILSATVETDAEVALTVLGANVTAENGNLLKGTTEDAVINEAAYVLGIVDGNVGLYKASTTGYAEGTFLNNAGKAYLPASVANGAAYYSFRFGEGTTGVEEVKTENGNVKTVYDLTGRRVEAITAPGIYIVGGKKVLVK